MEQDILNAPKKLIEYCVANGIMEVPRCVCGNKVGWNKAYPAKGFNQFCSDSCRKDNRKLKVDRDWLYHERIENQRSWESIADELGVSVIPVKRLAKEYKIPHVRFNESKPLTKIMLSDRDWMYEQHVIQRKTCEKIAEEIGSSKATVSLYMEKHGIETNKTNSYPRKHIVVSNGCREVVEFIESKYNGKIILNDRSILNGKEIDIYLPELQLGFEYNGVWSHLYRPLEATEARKKGRYYHVSKTDQALAAGVKLYHIWSSDWETRGHVWKSKITQLIGATTEKIAARKCVVSGVPADVSRVFLDSHHLQGKDTAGVRLGLYYSDELIAIMTFGKPRFTTKFDWELIRFCVKGGVSVAGGFSKLLNHFRKTHGGSIVSYANRMYSHGEVYYKNGFELININRPSYFYVKRGTETLLHKYAFRKQFVSPGDNRTESEIMDDLGFDIVWDCGTMTYALDSVTNHIVC